MASVLVSIHDYAMATRTRTAPTRVQIRPPSTSTSTEMNNELDVKCTGHKRRCPRLVAGPKSKNPGRAFYTCPLNRDDPDKCKFFKWEDELQAGSTTPQKPIRGGQTLGQSPQVNYARTPTKPAPPPAVSGAPTIKPLDDVDDIDWDKVDTDDLEQQAILSTPGSSQAASQDTPARARLRAAVDEGLKRKREDEEETPKRTRLDTDNPFLSTPGTPRTPSHPVLSPALASLEQVSEHIQRQERLIRAGEQMKQGLRSTVKSLQEKNKELEARVQQLEAELARK